MLILFLSREKEAFGDLGLQFFIYFCSNIFIFSSAYLESMAYYLVRDTEAVSEFDNDSIDRLVIFLDSQGFQRRPGLFHLSFWGRKDESVNVVDRQRKIVFRCLNQSIAQRICGIVRPNYFFTDGSPEPKDVSGLLSGYDRDA